MGNKKNYLAYIGDTSKPDEYAADIFKLRRTFIVLMKPLPSEKNHEVI